MKIFNCFLFTLFVFTTNNTFAQVGIGTTTPAPSAKLDISSTTQGLLPPRMTTAQKNAISTPVEGLLVYQTDSVRGIYVYTNGAWLNMIVATHYIGESFGGGIIFYLYDEGKHGLVAATADQNGGVPVVWDYNANFNTLNSVRNGLGAGIHNTQLILTSLGRGNYASFIAMNYNGGGFGDWYLPSKYELNLLSLQQSVVGGFVSGFYWSSTEFDLFNAWYQAIPGGFTDFSYKGMTYNVRAIRAF